MESIEERLFLIFLVNYHPEIPKLDKVLKNGPSKICGGQPLKNLK